jgi:transcriptional regulator with XRE-family HTH domain
MPRTKLTEAREKAELSQGELGKAIGSSGKTVSRWESGERKPQAHYCREIRRVLGISREDDPDLFKNFVVDGQQSHEIDEESHEIDEEEQDSQPCQQVEIRSNVDSSDSQHIGIQESAEGQRTVDPLRRNITTTIIGGVTLPIHINLNILTDPIITPEESLAQSRIAIADSWDDFKVGNFAKVGRRLNAHVPTLSKLASADWTHQEESANLGVQGSIMQLLLASRKMDFGGRVYHCKEAIKFAKLSGNGDLLAIARDWYGNTYTVCYRQPNKAKSILNKALKEMNSDSSPLVRSGIYSNLSIAHAQDKDKTKAAENERLSLDYIERAREVIRENHGSDPADQYIHWDLLVESLAGRSFLHLAERSSSGKYAQMAYDILVSATSKQAMSQDDSVADLIDQVDAARALGDMRLFIDSLEQALPHIGSKRRIVDAIDVANRVPDEWKSETAVQELQEDLNNLHKSLVVVQQ